MFYSNCWQQLIYKNDDFLCNTSIVSAAKRMVSAWLWAWQLFNNEIQNAGIKKTKSRSKIPAYKNILLIAANLLLKAIVKKTQQWQHLTGISVYDLHK